MMEATVYLEDNEYIALCDLLKLAGLAESGGQAKAFIAEGLVLRNGETETRKTAKIRGGEVIEFDGARLEIADGFGFILQGRIHRQFPSARRQTR